MTTRHRLAIDRPILNWNPKRYGVSRRKVNMGVDSFRRECRKSVEPLPDDIVVRLRSDETAALAAALIVASAFPNIASWAARVVCGSSEPVRQSASGTGSVSSNGADGDGDDQLDVAGGDETDRLDGANDKLGDSRAGRRRTEPKEQLLALMRANPGATVGRLAELTGRAAPAISHTLKRLEEAGLVDHRRHGSWSVAEDDLGVAAPSTAAPWLAPLSGRQVARSAACGRVRETTASAASE
jgi:DNA-binding transcriptional ArsR family regulator